MNLRTSNLLNFDTLLINASSKKVLIELIGLKIPRWIILRDRLFK